ncbi:MAG: hypothetical protein KJ955_03660 [Nanoarchaeota archaeon]|nr:hypothetical protein [Nanoarchaeota archaeon]
MFKEYRLGKRQQTIDAAVQQIIADFGEVVHSAEEMLRFKYDLVPELVEGRHKWTIRYKPNGFRHPCSNTYEKNVLPVCIDPDENGNWETIGHVIIPRMVVGHVKDWPERHKAIKGSGWRFKSSMVEGMSEIYRPIYHNRWIRNRELLFAYQLSQFRMTPEFAEQYKRVFG